MIDTSRPFVRQTIAWVSMIGFGVAWGGTIPLAKIAVSTGYGSLGLIFWQLVIGVAVLGAVLLSRGWRPVFNKQLFAYFLVIAIIGTIVPNGFSYLASYHLPGGVMSIAIALVPMFTLMIALGLRLEGPSLTRIIGVFIGFAAMVLIATPETSLPEPEKAIFVLVALIAPLCYGLEANYIALKTPEKTDAVSTLFMASFLGLFITAPLAVASGQWINPLQPWAAPEYALIGASVIHAVTYCGYIWLVGFGGPVFSVQMAYPVTLSGVFFSILLLEETYSGWIWSALVLVIIGLVLVQPKLEHMQSEEANA
ncbi:MAG: DMT family transporter [Pseudomonadota bacterium]